MKENSEQWTLVNLRDNGEGRGVLLSFLSFLWYFTVLTFQECVSVGWGAILFLHS